MNTAEKNIAARKTKARKPAAKLDTNEKIEAAIEANRREVAKTKRAASTTKRKAARSDGAAKAQVEVRAALAQEDGKAKKQAAEGHAICSVCGVERPLTTEFFQKNAAHKNGFQSADKTCTKKRLAAREAARKASASDRYGEQGRPPHGGRPARIDPR